MMGSRNVILGLALGEQSIACAEIATRGDQRTVRKAAELILPAGVSMDTPAQVGTALKVFLREKGFSASRAVVGVPARWLISQEKEVPPTDLASAHTVLRLQAERANANEGSERVYDYAGALQANRAGKVLLVSMLRSEMEKVIVIARTAGIAIDSITSTTLAMAAAVQGTGHDLPVVLLSSGGAEVAWQHGASARILQHLTVRAATVGRLGLDLRRTLALLPTNGSGPLSELLLWDAMGLDSEQLQQLQDKLGLRIKPGQHRQSLGVTADHPGSGDAQATAPAIALALAGIDPALLPLDFAASRLAPIKTPRINRWMAWGAIAAVLALAALIWLFVDNQISDTRLTAEQKELSGLAAQVKAADAIISRASFAREYFPTSRPAVLECMREVVMALPNDRIWILGITFNAQKRWEIQGKATNRDVVIELVTKLKASKGKFADATLTRIQAAGENSRENSFSIEFSFKPTE